MSLPAMSLEDRFCFSRNGGTGGGKWVHPKGANNMPSLGSALKRPWLALDSPFLSSFAKNGLRKCPLALWSPHF